MQITSADNPRVKLVGRLRKKRGRLAESRFVIDSRRDLARALAQGYEVDFLLHASDAREHTDLPLIDAPCHEIAPALLKRLSYRENPDGMIAVMHSRKPCPLPPDDDAIRSALLLVDLRVPGNIGALLRTADAAAIDAIVLVDCALDLYNPNIIRNSAGACFIDAVYQADGREALDWIRSRGMPLIAADAAGETPLYAVDFRGGCAIALGAEDRGLPASWKEACDLRVAVPMMGAVSDSLNVSVSGAIIMYEMLRQGRTSRDWRTETYGQLDQPAG